MCAVPVSYTHLWRLLQKVTYHNKADYSADCFAAAEAVSYTHLDVYKRQDIDHVLRLGGNTDRQRERVVAAFEKQKTTAETVSYTHLDVYKRQG